MLNTANFFEDNNIFLNITIKVLVRLDSIIILERKKFIQMRVYCHKSLLTLSCHTIHNSTSIYIVQIKLYYIGIIGFIGVLQQWVATTNSSQMILENLPLFLFTFFSNKCCFQIIDSFNHAKNLSIVKKQKRE